MAATGRPAVCAAGAKGGERMDVERFDAIVLGAGPGGEVVVYRLAPRGLRVALVERELIGGECGYWGCVPSKTLLRPIEIAAEARRGFGIAPAALDWRRVVEYRDFMVRAYDDARQVAEYGAMGVTVVKAPGRLVGPGAVEADGRRLEAPHVVVATGSEPVVLPVDGLSEAGYWTNREATSLRDVPRSIVVQGGGPVAVELAQMLAGYGAEVILVQRGERLLSGLEPEAGALLRDALERAGVRVLTGTTVVAVQGGQGGRRVSLSDGSAVTAEVFLAATGRRPRVSDVGLETVGVTAASGLAIDRRGHVKDGPEGLWAVGDVTGVALFTHVAKYQGRAVAANILAARGEGEPRELDHASVPRVAFTDPEVAAVGLSEAQAAAAGLPVDAATVELSSMTRPFTYEREPHGLLKLLARRGDGVVVGATAVGPLASEWIHVAALAVRAGLTTSALRDSMFQFPTFSEAYALAAERLAG
jgi:dihydrolipoamide dehydrogenase